jgi:hypothetical protein
MPGPISRNGSTLELQRSTEVSPNQSTNLLKTPISEHSLMRVPSAKKYPSSGSTTASLSDPSALTFDESLQLLHYCRLIYKTVSLIKGSTRMSSLRELDYFTNWLLFMIEDLEAKVQLNMDVTNTRHIKLKSVLKEYIDRYTKEFRRNDHIETSINAVKSVIDMLLIFLDNKIFVEPEQDQQKLVVIGQYLCFLQEINNIVKRCMETR